MTHRCFYLTVLFRRLINKFDLQVRWSVINLTFVCATYGSLYLLSSQSYVTLCGVLFQLATSTCPSSQVNTKSYVLQCYKTLIFADASLCVLVLSVAIDLGLNVRHLISHLVCHNKRFHPCISGLVVQVSAIPSDAKRGKRAKPILGFCNTFNSRTSFSFYYKSRILDYGCTQILAQLGSIGLKVVIFSSF